MSTFQMSISDGTVIVTIDHQDSPVNVFDLESMKEMESLLQDLAGMADDIPGIIFISGKERNFIAGADLSIIESITDAEEGRELARRGQRIMDLVADLPCPTVAAIHGSCLGGGLEFALSCGHRVSSDSKETFLGLPETRLGIIPGFGGTQRLPRLIGLPEALKMITTGERVTPRRAARIGLVDEVVATERLLDAARGMLGSSGSRKRPTGDVKGAVQWAFAKTRFGRGTILRKARRAVEEKTGGHYPAPLAALEAVEEGLNHGMEKGLEVEARLLGETAAGVISGNLIRVFRLGESFARGDNTAAAGISRLVVVGAGAMGGGIAALGAERGFTVRLVDTSPDSLGSAIKFLHQDVAGKKRRGRLTGVEAQWIPTRLTVDTQLRGVSGAGAAIEAVAERMEVKMAVFTDLAKKVPDDCLLLSNTSSLPVTDMAQGITSPARFAGMHFFNPVGKMPLVEVIRGADTGDEAVAATTALARRLGKTPIVVKDSPGFLVNRLLLPYLNEAAVLLEEGADVPATDAALKTFGMPMGAYQLVDQVGVDIAAHASKSMFQAFGDRMKPSTVLTAMLEAGRLGKKTGLGFYRWKGGRHSPAGDLEEFLAPLRTGDRTFTVEDLIARLIYPMVDEAARCLDEGVVETPEAVDAGMVFGAGFPPFTGGLLRYADGVGLKEIARTLRKLAREEGKRFSPSKKLAAMAREGAGFY